MSQARPPCGCLGGETDASGAVAGPDLLLERAAGLSTSGLGGEPWGPRGGGLGRFGFPERPRSKLLKGTSTEGIGPGGRLGLVGGPGKGAHEDREYRVVHRTLGKHHGAGCHRLQRGRVHFDDLVTNQ